MKVEKEQVRQNFSRAAATYDENSLLQQEIGSDLLDSLPSDFNSAKILDVGCGTGLLTEKLAQQYPDAEVTAIDISGEMITCARARHSANRINYLCGDVEIFWPYSIYDLVFSNATLQWLNDLPAFFKKVHGSLKVNGYFVFSVFLKQTFSRIRKLFQDNSDYQISHSLPSAELIAALTNDTCFNILHSDVKIKEIEYKGFMDFMKKQRLSGTLNAAVSEKSRGFAAVKNVLNAASKDKGPFTADYHYAEYIIRKSK